MHFTNENLLVERLKQGDERAFDEIVNSYQGMVYNTVLGLVQQEEDAEDIAQDVFVQVYQSIHTFKGESKLSTWLYRIATTKSLDHLRKRGRKKRSGIMRSIFGENNEEILQLPDFHHPGVEIDKKENAAVLFKAISLLPDNQKVAFVLNKIEGLSYQEICHTLQLSLSAVESLIHRAKLNLRNKLENYYKQL